MKRINKTVTVRFACGHVVEMPAGSLWQNKPINDRGERETIMICEDCEVEELSIESVEESEAK